jgi:hypothetical protein
MAASPEGFMPLRIGLVLYPLLPLALILARRGPASKLRRAGAISPQTARKPSTVDAVGDLSSHLKSGLIVATGDGRYYLDVAELRRRNRRVTLFVIVVGVAIGGLLLWLWPPWR